MVKLVKDLQVGDKIQTIKNGICEVVSIKYVPFPNVGVNCMTAEGNYYVIAIKKPNGSISETRGHKSHDKREVI